NAACAVLIGMLAFASVVVGSEPAHVKLDIQAQPIDDALNEFARQSGLQVFFLASQESKRAVSGAVVGVFTAEEALKKLLEPAGLKAEYVDSKTVAVRPTRETAHVATAEHCQSGVSQPDNSCVGFLRVAQHSQTDASSGQSPDEARSA